MSAPPTGDAALVLPSAPHALLDTDVYSLLFLAPAARRKDLRVAGWINQLAGVSVVIAAQTRAELGVKILGFTAKLAGPMRAAVDATTTAYPDERVVDQFAGLRFWARNNQHPLQQKENRGDALIAATAIVLDIPLLTGDNLYHQHGPIPGLKLL